MLYYKSLDLLVTALYTSPDKQIEHVDGINVVRKVIVTIKQHAEDPQSVLSAKFNFIGNPLEESALILRSLQQKPYDVTLFGNMMKACLLSSVIVLKRQYKRYFELDITEQLKKN